MFVKSCRILLDIPIYSTLSIIRLIMSFMKCHRKKQPKKQSASSNTLMQLQKDPNAKMCMNLLSNENFFLRSRETVSNTTDIWTFIDQKTRFVPLIS